MQILSINRSLLSIHVESVLKVFKYFNSFGVWSLFVGCRCFNISNIFGTFRVTQKKVKFLIKMLIFSLKSIGSLFPYNLVYPS